MDDIVASARLISINITTEIVTTPTTITQFTRTPSAAKVRRGSFWPLPMLYAIQQATSGFLADTVFI